EWFSKAAQRLHTHEENLRTLFTRLFPNQQLAQTTTQQPRPASQITSANTTANTALALLFTQPQAFAGVAREIKILQATDIDEKFLKIHTFSQSGDPDNFYKNLE